jgi:hypothetical protein
VRTGFNWLGIEKNVGLLYAHKWTVGFRKMQKISWLPEKLWALQYVPCSMVFVLMTTPLRQIHFFLWRCDPTRVMASSFLRFLDHIQRRTTVGRIPLDEWSARRKDLYLTTHNTHNRQTSMPRWDSKPRSQQANGRRPTPQTARPLGPADNSISPRNSVWISLLL